MRDRRVLGCAWVAAAFLLGFGAHALTGLASRGVATAALTAEGAGSCADPAAMAANRNLVDQIHEIDARLGAALAASPRTPDPAVSKERAGGLSPSAAEWARMAREGTVRVVVPCAGQDGAPSLETHAAGTTSLETGRGAGSVEARAKAAGLDDREIEALGEAYAVAHARTWAKMKDACAALAREGPRPEPEDGREPPPAPEDDYARIGACRGLVSDEADAVLYVAKLRAAGAPPERARSPRDRALLAYAESAEELARAMAERVGRDKAALAMSFGAVCLDELMFDTREPAPSEPASEGDEAPPT